MARLRTKPIYDAEKVMKELLEIVSASYEETGELKLTAEEFDMSALKIRKLLITAGVYHNDASDEVNRLYSKGKTPEEIANITGLGRSSVNGYLPYSKAIYKPEELSQNAERIKVFRNRQKAVAELQENISLDNLWKAVVVFQGYPFHTVSGLPFVYELKKGRGAEYNKELIVNRRKESKSIVWSSVKLVFYYALTMRGTVVDHPKALGDVRGVSYIYPLLYRFGIINVPTSVAEKMQLKRGRNHERDRLPDMS